MVICKRLCRDTGEKLVKKFRLEGKCRRDFFFLLLVNACVYGDLKSVLNVLSQKSAI